MLRTRLLTCLKPLFPIWLQELLDPVTFLKKILFIYFYRQGKGGRETSMCGCLSCAPYWGPWPATQACALTGNGTSDPVGSQASAQSTEPHQPGIDPVTFFK